MNRRIWPLFFASALIGACATSTSTADSEEDGSSADAIAPLTDVADAAADADDIGGEDTSPDADAGEADTDATGPDVPDTEGPADGELGWPCEDDAECDSRYCVSTADGDICASICNGECPEGYECRLFAGSGSDTVQLCVPALRSLCRPCDATADCDAVDAACLTLGDGDFCGLPCDPDAPCPEGFSCEPVVGAQEQCVPDLGICGQCLDLDGDRYGIGPECAGEDCNDESSDTYPSAAELCDGIDNDCDDDIDEDFDLQRDVEHCGECGSSCAADNGTPECVAGTCGIADCDEGWADCNTVNADGCEANTGSDALNCGLCGISCAASNAETACNAALCEIVACADGFEDCNGDPSDGCEVEIDADPTSCGACGEVCAFDNAAAICIDGTCAPGRCDDGFSDCNAAPEDGCEVSVLDDERNCGACAVSCERSGAETFCDSGSCALTDCVGTFADCDGALDNGCEADTETSLAHCGGCNMPCAIANAVTDCNAGGCEFVACAPGFVDLDGELSNGCEYVCTSEGFDVPDPDGLDTNCDGIDGDASRAVFVSPLGARAASGLTADDPVVGLDDAVAIAIAQDRSQILVAAGDYSVARTLVFPGSAWLIAAGYSTTFSTRSAARATLRGSISPVARFENSGPVEVIGVDFEAPASVAPGQANIAVIANSAQQLLLREVTIVAGPGGAGVAGDPGASPNRAVSGTSVANSSAGGAAVGSGVRRGGRGADGRRNDDGQTGGPGGTTGASCGGGGSGGDSSGCADGAPDAGGRGQDGCSGSSGAQGAGAAAGAFVGLTWQPSAARAGASGSAGGGGGGGGSGGGEGCFAFNGTGRGGGGGGEGGEAGGGGQAGTSGGPSVGLLASDSIVGGIGLVVVAAQGGAGGAGGAGGRGAEGGQGGDGGSNSDSDDAAGGRGGDGGRGGNGGCGGSGAGGDALGVLALNSSTLLGQTVWPVQSALPGAAGAAGIGCPANTRGAAGVFSTVRGAVIEPFE